MASRCFFASLALIVALLFGIPGLQGVLPRWPVPKTPSFAVDVKYNIPPLGLSIGSPKLPSLEVPLPKVPQLKRPRFAGDVNFVVPSLGLGFKIPGLPSLAITVPKWPVLKCPLD